MTALIIALLVAAGAQAVIVPILRRRRILDIPNGRSSHTLPTPRGGGIAVVLAIAVGVTTEAALGTDVAWLVLCLILAMAAVGFFDDLRSLSSRSRLLVQMAAGLGLASWLALTSPHAPWPALPFLLVSAVGFAAYVNAFNFMDGINAISSVSATLAGLWFAYLGFTHDLSGLTALGTAVAGAALGFLPWNAPTARVFLGDVGSYALGAAIVSMAVMAWAAGLGILTSTAPLLLYLVDTLWALLRRAVRGAPLAEPHREHVYQRLVDAGASHVRVASMTGAVTASVCAIALWGPGALTVVLIALALALYLLLPRLVTREQWASTVR